MENNDDGIQCAPGFGLAPLAAEGVPVKYKWVSCGYRWVPDVTGDGGVWRWFEERD
jgi:hypothetical protein